MFMDYFVCDRCLYELGDNFGYLREVKEPKGTGFIAQEQSPDASKSFGPQGDA